MEPVKGLELKAAWRKQQAELKRELITSDHELGWALLSAEQPLRLVGGVDVSFFPEAEGAKAAPAVPGGLTAGEGRAFAEHEHDSSATARAPASSPGDEDAPGTCERGVAALVVLTYPDLQVVYEDFEPLDLDVPYVPGFLAFREVPVYARLLARVASTPFKPQVVLVDGCGILHYEGFGAACHLGVATGVPTVGVAKNLLMVQGLDRASVHRALQEEPGVSPEAEAAVAAPPEAPSAHKAAASASEAVVPGPALALPASEATALGSPAAAPCSKAAAAAAGTGLDADPDAGPGPSHSAAPPAEAMAGADRFRIDRGPKLGRCVPLVGTSGDVLGVALRPGTAKNPIFVSVGHRVSLETAMELVWSCCRHRIPEPTRMADIKSRQYIREHRGLGLRV